MQIDYVDLVLAAGESASEPFELAVHNISNMQRRGLLPFVAEICLPADWSAATLLYEVSDDGIAWHTLSDLRGTISAAARAGQTLYSTADLWRGARWIRLRSEPPQRENVVITLGIGATVNSGAQFARPNGTEVPRW